MRLRSLSRFFFFNSFRPAQIFLPLNQFLPLQQSRVHLSFIRSENLYGSEARRLDQFLIQFASSTTSQLGQMLPLAAASLIGFQRSRNDHVSLCLCLSAQCLKINKNVSLFSTKYFSLISHRRSSEVIEGHFVFEATLMSSEAI